MIDAHCHIDLYDDPIALAQKIHHSRMSCVAVTMLPSHFRMGETHLSPFDNIHSALGIHPLRVSEGQNEVDDFLQISQSCEFIGEVGLDFSDEGKSTKELQIEVFSTIVKGFSRGKFVSIHSRMAHYDVARILGEEGVQSACFHYFTGGVVAAKELAKQGHFFSVNQRMLRGRNQDLVRELPRDRILVESDGPFLSKAPLSAIKDTYTQIGKIWGMDLSDTESLIAKNFASCRTR